MPSFVDFGGQGESLYSVLTSITPSPDFLSISPTRDLRYPEYDTMLEVQYVLKIGPD